MSTCRGNHQLVKIYSHGPDMERAVVRWCEQCGAITVDTDVDGRTAPGDLMSMRLPQTELDKQGKKP